MRINLLVLYQTYALHFSRRPQYNLFYVNISVFMGFKKDKQGTLLYDITFIGINVRKIRDCQKSRNIANIANIKIANIQVHQVLFAWKKTLEKCVIVKRVQYDWDSNLRAPDYKTIHRSDTISLSYRACPVLHKKQFQCHSRNIQPVNDERRQHHRAFYKSCNLSSCRVL